MLSFVANVLVPLILVCILYFYWRRVEFHSYTRDVLTYAMRSAHGVDPSELVILPTDAIYTARVTCEGDDHPTAELRFCFRVGRSQNDNDVKGLHGIGSGYKYRWDEDRHGEKCSEVFVVDGMSHMQAGTVVLRLMVRADNRARILAGQLCETDAGELLMFGTWWDLTDSFEQCELRAPPDAHVCKLRLKKKADCVCKL